MSQSYGERIKEEIRMLVRKLFRAENYPGDKNAAASVLATDYLPITRGKGQVDRDRDQTLRKIADSSRTFHREVDTAEIEVALFLDNRVAIARSLLPTNDSKENPPAKASYRNMQIFLKRDDQWQCVAWQVTKVQEEG